MKVITRTLAAPDRIDDYVRWSWVSHMPFARIARSFHATDYLQAGHLTCILHVIATDAWQSKERHCLTSPVGYIQQQSHDFRAQY